jgi:signal transduction histidine kinase
MPCFPFQTAPSSFVSNPPLSNPLDVRTVASVLDAVELGVVGLVGETIIYANDRAVLWLGHDGKIAATKLRAWLADAQTDAPELPSNEAPGRHFRVGDRILGFSCFTNESQGFDAQPTEWILLRDITERLWLRRSTESLAQVNNLGFMLAGITHELGNPINAVKMAASVLIERSDQHTPEDRQGYFREIYEAARRMQDIVRLMQSFVRVDALQAVETDVRASCVAFCSIMDLAGRRGVIVRFGGDGRPAEPLVARVDPAAFRQILLNLFSNAFDAFEPTDPPTACDCASPATVILDAWSTPGRIHISVTDNGCGMTDAQLERLFVPFASTKATGTGFGLVIVKKLVTLMGGTIEVSAERGHGTRIELVFPSVVNRLDERNA